jgi:titin
VKLVAPARLAGRATSSTAVALTWRDKALGEESYVVEAKVNARKAKFQGVATLPAGAAAAQVTGLTPGTSYTFRVRAVAGGKSSPYSNAVVIGTPR